MLESLRIPSISLEPLHVQERYEGGFGRIYIVETTDGERYALKTLKWELGQERAVLRDEARKLADVTAHPNVVEILGVSWHEGDPFIAMHYYPATLRSHPSSGRRAVDSLIDAMADVARGLNHLHDLGVLHLDLKPENVLVSADGRFAISDFGLSAVLPPLTASGIHRELFVSGVTGTLAYMSPEHFITGRLTPKSDIFALGTMIFEALTGRHPFLAASPEETVEHILMRKPAFHLKERLRLPGFLRKVCVACVRKAPEHRPSAREVVNLLERQANLVTRTETSEVDPSRLVNKANTLRAVGRVDDARRTLEDCLRDYPWYLSALIGLAYTYWEQNDIPRAASILETALEAGEWIGTHEDMGNLLTNLSFYYLSIEPRRSIRYARKAVDIDERDWQALGNLAEACRLLGSRRQECLEEGLDACRRAMKINPDDLKLKVTYGGLLLEANNGAELWPYVVSLVNAHGGDDVPLRLLLIRSLAFYGKYDEAERWLAPMRQHSGLAGVVQAAEEEITRRKDGERT